MSCLHNRPSAETNLRGIPGYGMGVVVENNIALFPVRAFIWQRGPNNNMADSSARLTVRLPCDWLNVKHAWSNYVDVGDVSYEVVKSYIHDIYFNIVFLNRN